MRFTFRKMLSVLLVLLLLVPLAAIAEDGENDSDDDGEYEQAEEQVQSRPQAQEQSQAQESSEPIYVVDYFKGTALDLSQYAGKAVFLNFFTEWCPYCMEEMPDIKRIYDTYDPNSLVIILVHPWSGEDETNTASVVARFGLEGLTTVEDKDMAISDVVGVPGYPTSVFIDQNGYLYYAVASKLEYDFMTQIVDGMRVPLRDGTIRQPIVPAKTSTSNHGPSNTAPSNPAPDATAGATPKN